MSWKHLLQYFPHHELSRLETQGMEGGWSNIHITAVASDSVTLSHPRAYGKDRYSDTDLVKLLVLQAIAMVE